MNADLLTRKTLAIKLSVSQPTIVRWEEQGFPVIRIGGIVRYDIDKVEAWLNERNGKKVNVNLGE